MIKPDEMLEKYRQEQNGVFLVKLSAVDRVLSVCKERQWIILGGDVLTVSGKYTYDNWFYDPIKTIPLRENVDAGIQKTTEYIGEYVKLHGTDYLFSLVISDAYR